MEIPIEFRWEFTRRHPYYVMFWQLGHRLYAGECKDELEKGCARLASTLLLGINVSGDPPPPTASFSELGAQQLASAWINGAVAPLTYRSLIGLLAKLSDQQRFEIITMLSEALAWPEDGEPCASSKEERRFALIEHIRFKESNWLDQLLALPIVSINLKAPMCAIQEAMDSFITEHKNSLDMPEVRRRPEKLDLYLRVWDLREGWSNGDYAAQQELSFVQIAAQLHTSVTTVFNQYRAAFRFVTGHEYSFENWIRIFAVVKLGLQFAPQLLVRRYNRKQVENTSIKPVPESSLMGGHAQIDGGIINSTATSSNDLGAVELMIDIQSLMEKGKSDAEIIEELELPNHGGFQEGIAYLRKRAKDDAKSASN